MVSGAAQGIKTRVGFQSAFLVVPVFHTPVVDILCHIELEKEESMKYLVASRLAANYSNEIDFKQ